MDRVWLHPTELFAGRAAAQAPLPRVATRRRVEWPLALLAAIVGSALTIGALQAAGELGGSARTAVGRAAVGTTAAADPDDLVDAEPIARLVANVSPSVVAVSVKGTIRASGVCLRVDNIVTTASAVAGASEVVITDIHGRSFTAKVVGTDPSSDLALLTVDGANLEVARTGAAGNLALGQSLVTVTAGTGGQRTASAGIVSAHDVVARSVSGAVLVGLLQTDIDSFTSGGSAVIDRRGRVIGLSAAAADGEPNGLVVPIEVVESVADQLRVGGVVHQGWLGIVGTDASNRERGGVVVTAVVDASPAALAGLQVGDLITDLDGDRLASWSALLARIRQHPAAAVELVAWRGQERLTMKIPLGRRAVTQVPPPAPAPAPAVDVLAGPAATPAAIG